MDPVLDTVNTAAVAVDVKYALQGHFCHGRLKTVCFSHWQGQQNRADQWENSREVPPAVHNPSRRAQLRRSPDQAPDFVIHEVKDAVQYMKKNAVKWRDALKKELSAIERVKGKQQQFFTFMISAVSGRKAFGLSGLAYSGFMEWRVWA